MNKTKNNPVQFFTLLAWVGRLEFLFLLKFVLLWYGYLKFDAFSNLLFSSIFIISITETFWHKLRNWIAIPYRGYAFLPTTLGYLVFFNGIRTRRAGKLKTFHSLTLIGISC